MSMKTAGDAGNNVEITANNQSVFNDDFETTEGTNTEKIGCITGTQNRENFHCRISVILAVKVSDIKVQ